MPTRIEGEIGGSALLLVVEEKTEPSKGPGWTRIIPCRGPAELEAKRTEVLKELQERFKISVFEWKKEGSD